MYRRKDGGGRNRFKLDCHQHPRLMAAGNHDLLHPAAPQLRTAGLQGILARFQAIEKISAISCCCGACLRARRLVARDDYDAFQRPGVQVGQPAGE